MRASAASSGETLVSIRDAKLHYRVGGALSALRGRSNVVKAVDGVSFEIARGESVGLLGESGCGKTSMGRLLLRLERATGGEIVFDGADVLRLKGKRAEGIIARARS